MNLFRTLQAQAALGRPVRVGLIGAGRFGTMFLAQVPQIPGLEVAGIADLSPDLARAACRRAGWDAAQIEAIRLVDDPAALFARGDIEVIVEATGDAAAGLRHAVAAIDAGQHVVMANVEADALAGPLLARRAARAGVVYSLAYGDQPALICELVDWARASGFTVVAAGKGTRYLPAYHASTPATVWSHYGMSEAAARTAGLNRQMFNSFLDGTKSAIEMAAVANATGLAAPEDGLGFPPAGTADLAAVLSPAAEGGVLAAPGQVEVVSSLHRDGRDVAGDLRWGVFVVFEPASDYARRCLGEYGLVTDPAGRRAAMWRPWHLIGLELSVSILSAALRGEPTGAPDGFRGDVAAIAKRALRAGEILDGEGGEMAWGKLLPARASVAGGCVPIGLTGRLPLRRDVAAGAALTWDDVRVDPHDAAYRMRREMETAFAE